MTGEAVGELLTGEAVTGAAVTGAWDTGDAVTGDAVGVAIGGEGTAMTKSLDSVLVNSPPS